MKPARPKRTRQRARVRQMASLPHLTEEQYKQLESVIDYTFTDRALIDRAMTHASAISDKSARFSYERLEFLGDRVLGLVIAEFLFLKFEGEPEGGLAPRLNALVNRDACAEASKRMRLDEFLLLNHAEEKAGGRQKVSILSDICESLLGAVYLDGGLKPARAIIEKAWAPMLKGLGKRPKDPKSILQEWAQGAGLEAPVYEIIGRVGPDHAPEFAACVQVGEFAPVEGRGKTKQEAQREAARRLLEEHNVEGIELNGV